MSNHILPTKTASYLKRLLSEYKNSNQTILFEIINTSLIYIIEETEVDNWDGGIYGHDIKLFIPEPVLEKIKLSEQKTFSEKIRADINICAESIRAEYIRNISIELIDDNDAECTHAKPLSNKPQINPDNISFWEQGKIRLFVSHRDKYKTYANELAEHLKNYGISAFVAHDSIEPMSTWQNEIIKGLETMEIMLTFVTDDFHESVWTNQEIGYALGKGTPIISLKLQNADPNGFIIKDIQALKGSLDAIHSSANKIYKLVIEKLGKKHRIQSSLIDSFIQSVSFDDAKFRFDLLKNVVDKLTDEETYKIIKGFKDNNQLHNSIYLTNRYNRLINFLNDATNTKYTITGMSIMSEAEFDEYINTPF